MNAKTTKTIRNLVDLHHRGIECENELFTFVVEEAERESLAGYLALLPPAVACPLPEWLDSQPKLNAEWASFYLPQLDGSEESFRLRIANYGEMVEAFRAFLSKNPPDPGREAGD